MLKVKPEVSETGSIAVYARSWRSAKWPDGLLYWEEFREMQLPLNRLEYEASKAERWVLWNVINSIALRNFLPYTKIQATPPKDKK